MQREALEAIKALERFDDGPVLKQFYIERINAMQPFFEQLGGMRKDSLLHTTRW